MRNLLTFIIIASAVVIAQEKPLPLPTPEKPKEVKEQKLSELSQLKAENFNLRKNLTQCRVDLLDRETTLASANLTTQQSKLEAEFRKELGCKPTDKFDWATLKCAANEKDPVK